MTAVERQEPGGLGSSWEKPTGRFWWFADLAHKSIGRRYMITAFAFFLIGGVQALLLRLQLARPENDVLDPDVYNELFTMHGTTMMFLFVIPFLEGLASYLIPLMIGTRDLPFPRFNAFNYWCYLFGGLLLYSSFLFALVPDAGWFSYVPLSGPDFSADKGMDFWLFGLTLAEIAAIGAAVEIIVAVLRMRAPGMSLDRIPLFGWAMLATAAMVILAFVPLVVASVLLELDRTVGTTFFDQSAGGNPLLWQHLFWIFGHPEVYVMFLPATGIISHVVQVHSRRGIVAYPLVVAAIIVTAFISLGLWVHHMYTTGLPPLTLSFFTAASMTIALASGIQIVAWIATIWQGRPRFTVPMLYAVGFVVTFVLGGITGVMVASVPFDEQAHDSFFVVAHFHYVLIGGVIFPIFAGIYHWIPKVTGHRPDDRFGHASFWLVLVGFHVTFFPMHLAGLWGMPRRVYTFPRDLGLDVVNLISTIGAFVLAAGIVVFAIVIARTWRAGPDAGPDPWGGDTLEWLTPSPPPRENFVDLPVVDSRHPLWDPDPPDDVHPEVREIFSAGPVGFRGTPATSVMAADPESVVYLARPTHWPIAPALGLLVVAAGFLADWMPLAVAGVVLVVVGLVAWAVRNEAEHAIVDEVPEVGGMVMDTSGPRAIGWWGAAATVVIGLAALGTLVFSGLFLQVNDPAWPQEDRLGAPALSVLTVFTLLTACTATSWASGRVQDRQQKSPWRRDQTVAGLLALLTGSGAAVLLIVQVTASDIAPTAHAYDSVALLLVSWQVLSIVAALAATGIALLRIRRYELALRARLLMQCAAGLWGLSVVSAIAVYALLQAAPGMV